MSRYQKNTCIGDISVIFSADGELLDLHDFVVEVRDWTQNKTLEVLEYPSFVEANDDYNMLCSLLKKIAAIHPLVKV